MDRLFIIIAAFNEEKMISNVLKELTPKYKNVVVVDDGSADKTFETANKHEVTVLKHIVNLGKGAALKTGCEYAVNKGAEIMVFIDADGQHLPSDIPRFLKAIKGRDIVFSYRNFRKEMPLILKMGNNLINLVTHILFSLKIKDTQCGFRALRSEAYKKIKWQSTSYPVESEMIANTGRKRLKYSEIPIKTIYKEKYKGTTIFDGMKIILNMIKWRLRF